MNQDKINLNVEEEGKVRDRMRIEECFDDFEKGDYLTEEEMLEKFKKVGWGTEPEYNL